jgi:hypothetical protein
MKFGVREICNVVFKAKADVKIGGISFPKNSPVLYIDSAKTSTIEGAATTVYAQGGRGNTRLIAWEGEKTLTFTVEDALLSPMGFAILSGAGLLKGNDKDKKEIHVHMTTMAQANNDGSIDLTDALETEEEVCADAPIYVLPVDADGSLNGAPVTGTADGKTITATGVKGACFVDYYVTKTSDQVSELQIDAENFAGYYYVEASTLFRRQDNGRDMPAEITFPNVKIQSNFTFNMASTGDPSTFTFTMDALPGYTQFEPTRKVLCAIQIIEDTIAADGEIKTVFPCAHGEATGD